MLVVWFNVHGSWHMRWVAKKDARQIKNIWTIPELKTSESHRGDIHKDSGDLRDTIKLLCFIVENDLGEGREVSKLEDSFNNPGE